MSIPSHASNLDAIIAHAGDTVVIGSVTGSGIFRREEVTAVSASGGLEVIGQQLTLTVREGYFSGLTQDAAVTVGGISYKLRDPSKPKSDGTRKMVLVEASP